MFVSFYVCLSVGVYQKISLTVEKQSPLETPPHIFLFLYFFSLIINLKVGKESLSVSTTPPSHFKAPRGM